MRENGRKSSPAGFRLVGREYNRIARLSGTNDPNIVNSFRTSLNYSSELITFLTPDYSDDGGIVPSYSLENLVQSSDIPQETCLATIEVRCERNFDYIPSRSTHFFFYCAHKIMVVSHIVHNGPPLDCPGEEWEARAYEGPSESPIHEFFTHRDGAVSIELETQPLGLLRAVLPEHAASYIKSGESSMEFRPVMQPNREAAFRFSPPEVPNRGSRRHLKRFLKILKELHVFISRATRGHLSDG
jgi:hypothetical protein